MDLSGYAAWAGIIGAIQQLPQTIGSLRALLGPEHGSSVAEKFASELIKLSEAFIMLGELKNFHDETQILHNSFHKVIALTNGQPKHLNLHYIEQNWRFTKPEFERFFATLESYRRISPVLPNDDVAQLHDCIGELNEAIQTQQPDQIMDTADKTEARITAILTKADRTLKQAIEDIGSGVHGMERGLHSED